MSTEELAKNIIKIQFKDLPKEVVEATKKNILDTIGVMLPSTTIEEPCISIYELAKEIGGAKESTLIGFGGKVPSFMAAFVNGSLTHAMDYDDTTDDPIHHPTSSVLPATLAIAEKIGGVSGKAFITAVALGTDLGVRLAASPKGNILKDWPIFPITTFGVFTSAVGAGKLLGLSEAQMQDALGLALHRVAGITKAVNSPNSQIRAIRDAFTNKEGVVSAIMASKGITATKEAIETLFESYYGGEYDPTPLTESLGKKFRGTEASLKLWPTCRATQGFVQAILQLMNENSITPDQVEDIVLTVGVFGEEHLCTPLDIKCNPINTIGAKFSLPFVAAVALTKGEVKIGHFLPKSLKDPEVLAMCKRVRYKVDPTFRELSPAQTEIVTKDGKRNFLRVEIIRGNPQNPLSLDELVAKFEDCASYSKKRLTKGKIHRLISTILDLEKVNDIREITDVFNS